MTDLLPKNMKTKILLLPGLLALLLSSAVAQRYVAQGKAMPLRTPNEEALANGRLANEGFARCVRYMNGWLAYADPVSGLIPRNLRESKDYWNAWDAAADNYPFMVLTASILSPDIFHRKMLYMLESERSRTSRLGSLPDTYSFSKRNFKNALADTSEIIFGSAEYMKDGLIPLTEWLGKSPWSDRMLEILNDLEKRVRVVSGMKKDVFGKNSTEEVNGDLLQTLSRMYWFTGERKYLNWAAEIADHYLYENHPTKTFESLKIRDHGCEIISGLCEVYLAASYAWPEKRNQWKKPIHEMLDRILEVGRNEDGLFYNAINPVTGKIIEGRIADNWGYTFNAYYFIGELDNIPAYRAAVLKGLNSLYEKYCGFDWENGSCDGYADAIEGGINLYNREPIPSLKDWLDSEIQLLWNYQKPDGIIEGWHGDGNFARTTIMYCLWKTQGILPVPWKEDLIVGATTTADGLIIALSSTGGWKGKLKFNSPKYKENMHLPIDYPRINQFQNWFTPEGRQKYRLTYDDKSIVVTGSELMEGIPFEVQAGKTIYLRAK